MAFPSNPRFTLLKMAFVKGVYISWTCLPDAVILISAGTEPT